MAVVCFECDALDSGLGSVSTVGAGRTGGWKERFEMRRRAAEGKEAEEDMKARRERGKRGGEKKWWWWRAMCSRDFG